MNIDLFIIHSKTIFRSWLLLVVEPVQKLLLFFVPTLRYFPCQSTNSVQSIAETHSSILSKGRSWHFRGFSSIFSTALDSWNGLPLHSFLYEDVTATMYEDSACYKHVYNDI